MTPSAPSSAASSDPSLRQLALVFLKLGSFGFGGAAGLIGMMHHEIVAERKWVDEQTFLDLLAVSNVLPGLGALKLAMYIGYRRGGWAGLALAGLLLILPSALLITGLAWVYVTYGALPVIGGLLYAIKPVVIAILAQTLGGLAKSSLKKPHQIGFAVVGLVLYLLGVSEIILLLGTIAIIILYRQLPKWNHNNTASLLILPHLVLPLKLVATATYSLGVLSWTSLKIGTFLFGGGYVLVTYLGSSFVDDLGWLTKAQLVDAIAIGQSTPGPFFSTMSFIGYLTGSWLGAAVAMISLVAPSVVFVAVSLPWLGYMRRSALLTAILDGISGTTLGLVVAITLQLGWASIIDLPTLLIAVVAFAALQLFKVNPAWLILAGGLLSLVIGGVY